MPTLECLQASSDRIDRAINRLKWQKRLLARAKDPELRRVAEKMVITLEEVVQSLQEAHALLVRRSERNRDKE